MIVRIETIKHEHQRYPTVGDWWFSKDGHRLDIRVSELGDARKEHLIAIHEYEEAILCQHRGISERQVTLFDLAYESAREQGNPHFQDEPGNHPDSPYFKEHAFASRHERELAKQLEIDWEEYNAQVDSL